MNNIATLSNDKDIILFKYKNICISFKGPYSLEFFSKVLKYEDGYIEVMTKYKHNTDLEEEYIDLKPIVNELYMDDKFLKDIKGVVVSDV